MRVPSGPAGACRLHGSCRVLRVTRPGQRTSYSSGRLRCWHEQRERRVQQVDRVEHVPLGCHAGSSSIASIRRRRHAVDAAHLFDRVDEPWLDDEARSVAVRAARSPLRQRSGELPCRPLERRIGFRQQTADLLCARVRAAMPAEYSRGCSGSWSDGVVRTSSRDLGRSDSRRPGEEPSPSTRKPWARRSRCRAA